MKKPIINPPLVEQSVGQCLVEACQFYDIKAEEHCSAPDLEKMKQVKCKHLAIREVFRKP